MNREQDTDSLPKSVESSTSLASKVSRTHTLSVAMSVIQLLAVALCLEMLLGGSDGAGPLLRLFLIAVVMLCIVLRLGWLALVAIQSRLLFQEPGNWQLQFSPGVLWVVIALITVVAAMKLPQMHRTNACLLMEWFGTAENHESATQPSPSRYWNSIAIQIILILVLVGLASILMAMLPIGPRTNRWLASSVSTGRAFWPGAIWLAVIVACFVLAREVAWRMMVPRQASLYLRSVNLISNYRDLARLERARRKWIRTESVTLNQPTSEASKPTERNRGKRMGKLAASNKTDLKGEQ